MHAERGNAACVVLTVAFCRLPIWRLQLWVPWLRLPRAATRPPAAHSAHQPAGHQHDHHPSWWVAVPACTPACMPACTPACTPAYSSMRHCIPRAADTFATVLLPEDAGEESLLELPGSLQQRSSGSGARAAAGQAAADEEELVPVSAQVQARLEGVCLQLDSFAAHEGGSTQMRCALLVRHLEVRDSFQLRQGGGSGAGAAATGWSDLRRMLGYHASVHRMRGAKACMLQVAVEGIRSELCAGKHAVACPSSACLISRWLAMRHRGNDTRLTPRHVPSPLFLAAAEVEYRVQVQLLPLLLHIYQAALAFLQHFFAPAGESSVVASSNCSAQVDASSGASPQPTGS